MTRLRSFGVAALALLPLAAYAQFDGPAPLAWRWQAFTKTLSGGSPLYANDKIYFAMGQRVYCLDRESGNQLWVFPNTEPIEGNFRSTPVLVEGVLVASADNKNIYGIDPNTGGLKWVAQAANQILGDLVPIGKNVVYKMQGNLVQGVDVTTGANSYSAPLIPKQRISGQLAGYGGNLLYFTQDLQLVGLDFNTQKEVWRQRFTTLPAIAEPIISGEALYTYSGQYLVSLLASTGTQRWQKQLPEQAFSAPVVGPNYILAVSATGNAYFYDLNGNLKTNKPLALGFQPITTPTAVGDKFLVPTSNGALNLINPETGTIDWQFVIRPATDTTNTTTVDSGGPGSRGGGPAGGLGGPGGQGIGGRGGQGIGGPGGQGIGRTSQAPERILYVQASSPAVLAGSTLLVPARDGSLLAFDKNFGVDFTAPSVKMVWPTPGEDIAGLPPLELVFKIEDEASGLKEDTIKLEIDGVAYESTFSRDGYLVAKISSTGANKPLQNGRRTVVVTAQDWMKNETKQTFTLNVDNSLKPLVRPTSSPNDQNGPGGNKGGGLGGGRDGGR